MKILLHSNKVIAYTETCEIIPPIVLPKLEVILTDDTPYLKAKCQFLMCKAHAFGIYPSIHKVQQ